jgi:hypothetical protein
MAQTRFYNIALVLLSDRVPFLQVQDTAAAIQRQIQSPQFLQWPGTQPGRVVAVTDVSKIPADCAPVYIQDDIKRAGLEGFHVTQQNQLPYAYVLSDGCWSMTASHESLELLIDPTGNLTLRAPSVQDSTRNVLYLVEVCDPVNDPANAIASGPAQVCDFYLPSYFDAAAVPGKAYSANSLLTAPLQILAGGYVVFQEANGLWYQANGPSGNLQVFPIPIPDFNGSLRERVDFLTGRRLRHRRREFSPNVRMPKVRKISAKRLREYREHERSFQIMIRKYNAKKRRKNA